jgi:hypothetical protein
MDYRKIVYTVNPDGSGKFAFETFDAAPIQVGHIKFDTRVFAKSTLNINVKCAEGVDAWTDLDCGVLQDGRLHTQGVGYFPDLAKVRFFGYSNCTWSKNDKGMTLELALGSQVKQATTKPKELTDEQVAQQIKQSRAIWQQRKATISNAANSKFDRTFMLPGKLGDVEGLTKTDRGGVQIVLDYSKEVDGMDKAMADDKLMAEYIEAGRDPMLHGLDQEKLAEIFFGKKIKAFKADVTGDLKPLFDYKAEMEKAKAAQDKMAKRLGLDPIFQPKAPPVKKGDNPPPGQ